MFQVTKVVRRPAAIALLFALLAVGALLPGVAQASNASSAAHFLETAQNSDGGFSATYGSSTKSGGASSPEPSLWATVALLAAGKNPSQEKLNNGKSAQDYLVKNAAKFTSPTDLGLLAIVEGASGATSGTYPDTKNALKQALQTRAKAKADPEGAAMGALGLLALKDKTDAKAVVQWVLPAQDSDGGWGESGKDLKDPSAATALVLDAMAETGIASANKAVVHKGIKYLGSAQIPNNDGSIANSTANATMGSGDVPATAFTVQALDALHEPTLKAHNGKTVAGALSNFQQQSGAGAGGLDTYGSYATGVPASIIDTAEAYPAFDGISLPLPYVAPAPPPQTSSTPTKTTPKPPPPPKASLAPKKHGAKPKPKPKPPPPVNRSSVGTSHSGVSSSTQGPKKSPKAFQGASTQGKKQAKAAPHHKSVAPSSGNNVTGSEIGAQPPPKLQAAAGKPPKKDHTALYLGLALAAVFLIGGALEGRRPRKHARPPVAAGLQRGADFATWLSARGSLPALGVAALGAALVLLPVLTGLWGGASRGAAMLSHFKPHMAPAQLNKLQGDLHTMNTAFSTTSHTKLLSQFDRLQWPLAHAHFQGTLDAVSQQRGHFNTLSSLPSLSSFPWFLLIPGVLLLALAAAALILPRTWPRLRLAVAALGAVLVIAPLALGLFSAGSQGATLVKAFAPVETHQNVSTLQDDFGTLSTGYSDSLQLTEQHGGAKRYPAAAAMNKQWTKILGDFTPLLGVMSDNVANYQAVQKLPNFKSFGWLFLIPGVLALSLALAGAHRLTRIRQPRERSTQPTTIEARSNG